MNTFFLINSNDSEYLFFADFHGTMDSFSHSGGVLVDGHHSYFVIVLEKGDIAAIFF